MPISTPTKSALTPARKRLVELMQKIHFGRVEGIDVADGEPILSPKPRVVRTFKCGGDNGPRPESALGDFPLKRQIVDLMTLLDEVGDGRIALVEVLHGLPHRVEVAGWPAG